MNNFNRCLFVTGPSRSGTSMVAGLFAAHGVWFGPCVGPREINKKGFFESEHIKRHLEPPEKHLQDVDYFMADWDAYRRQNGCGGLPWGVKTGPHLYPFFAAYDPVVVVTVRFFGDIVASRKRAGFTCGAHAVMKQYQDAMSIDARRRVIANTDEIATGDCNSLKRAFEYLQVEFRPEIAEQWIDREMWNGRDLPR